MFLVVSVCQLSTEVGALCSPLDMGPHCKSTREAHSPSPGTPNVQRPPASDIYWQRLETFKFIELRTATPPSPMLISGGY